MKIFLCRHGQTTGDVEDRFGGDYEDHLTEEGKNQAQFLAEKLAGKDLEIIFTSPRIRALETSEILKSVLGTEVLVLEDIRERNHYGILTGMIKSEAQENFPEEIEKMKDNRTCATGGEDYEFFKTRINIAWQGIQNSGYQAVAVVTHGGPIRLIFREILKLGELKLSDSAFAELESSDSGVKVINLNGIELENNQPDL